MIDVVQTTRRNTALSAVVLLTSAGTLVCCALPAVLVAAGAGAALASLVTAVPQLIWLSEHKAAVFGVTVVMLALGGIALRHASRLPCPTEPTARQACTRLRRVSATMYALGLAGFAVGVTFAFVLPALVH